MSGTRAEGKDVMPGLSGRLSRRRGEFWVFTVTEGNLGKEQPGGSSSETLFAPADPREAALSLKRDPGVSPHCWPGVNPINGFSVIDAGV